MKNIVSHSGDFSFSFYCRRSPPSSLKTRSDFFVFYFLNISRIEIRMHNWVSGSYSNDKMIPHKLHATFCRCSLYILSAGTAAPCVGLNVLKAVLYTRRGCRRIEETQLCVIPSPSPRVHMSTANHIYNVFISAACIVRSRWMGFQRVLRCNRAKKRNKKKIHVRSVVFLLCSEEFIIILPTDFETSSGFSLIYVGLLLLRLICTCTNVHGPRYGPINEQRWESNYTTTINHLKRVDRV